MESQIPECTVKDLLNVLSEKEHVSHVCSKPLDEVYRNLFIGDEHAARDVGLLQKCGIKHVINAAHGNRRFQHVNVDPSLYSEHGIKFMAVDATDTMRFKLCQYFQSTSRFIEDALCDNGRVLVHCREGVSRSATVVLAFLIARRNMTVQEALREVCKRRAIFPNQGFLQQLCDLDKSVRQHNAAVPVLASSVEPSSITGTNADRKEYNSGLECKLSP